MSEAEVINYMRQICEGVKHMHERNIIHLGKDTFIQIYIELFFFIKVSDVNFKWKEMSFAEKKMLLFISFFLVTLTTTTH